MDFVSILEIDHLEKHFFVKRGIFKGKSINKAVDDVTFEVRREEIFGLVGE